MARCTNARFAFLFFHAAIIVDPVVICVVVNQKIFLIRPPLEILRFVNKKKPYRYQTKEMSNY